MLLATIFLHAFNELRNFRRLGQSNMTVELKYYSWRSDLKMRVSIVEETCVQAIFQRPLSRSTQ